jgi:streptogramin lyase
MNIRIYLLGCLAVLGLPLSGVCAVSIGHEDIGGVVSSASGPEGGVWVIAETGDLPTKYRKIVVTDDAGRYVIPGLPAANYQVWVRGYGLVDSAHVQAKPGQQLNLTAVVAPNASAAAQYYPANYWFSMLEIPPRNLFPGTGDEGNGIGRLMSTQDHFIAQIKVNCEICHEIGTKLTRETPEALRSLSTADAWDHRMQTGQDGVRMITAMAVAGQQRASKMFSSWIDRIAAGELPPVPPRPQGVERNLVLTLWDWGGPTAFTHDERSTDKRNPTLFPNGPIYGANYGNDMLLAVDPKTNSAVQYSIPTEPGTGSAKPQSKMVQPSLYWGGEMYWSAIADPNHATLDKEGRVWLAARFRNPDHQPAFCATHPSAKLAPMQRSFRHIVYFDPKTKAFHDVNVCFDTHHLQFGNDPDETIYANGPRNGTIGWVRTKQLLKTGDEAASQGWCKPYHDINRDGKVDPTIDVPVQSAGIYSVIPDPVDGSVWGAVPEPTPGRIVRIDPKTCVGEAYEPPFDPAAATGNGYTPRGIDIDSQGVIWTALAGSAQLASFDRRKCKVLDGPESVDGQHCREGWTLYPAPGPKFKNSDVGADFHYYNFVDQFNTLGLGKDIPLANGTGSDSLLALNPKTGKWVILRVPYPLNFYQRGMDGRIDDPKGGWKGRGMYANYGQNAVWHMEGGKGTLGALVKFQLRPDPLAR